MNDRFNDLALKPKTTVDKVVEAMSAFPVGRKFRSGELSILAGVSQTNFSTLLAPGVAAGRIAVERASARCFFYSLPTEAPAARPEPAYAPRARPAAQESPRWRRVQQDLAEPTSVLHGKLCDLFRQGTAAITGDPMRLLLDAIDAGRKVLDAKAAPGCRFNGAEVDRMVARELRQVAEAAQRARVNLERALEVMGTG